MQLCVAAARTSTDRLPHTRAESRTMVLIEMRREGGGCGFGREQQAGVQLTCSAPRVSRVHAAELSRARGGGGRSAGHRAEQWC